MALGGGQRSRPEPGAKPPAPAGAVARRCPLDSDRPGAERRSGVAAVSDRPGSGCAPVGRGRDAAPGRGAGTLPTGLLDQFRARYDVGRGAAVGRSPRLLPCGTSGPPRGERGRRTTSATSCTPRIGGRRPSATSRQPCDSTRIPSRPTSASAVLCAPRAGWRAPSSTFSKSCDSPPNWLLPRSN